eukprot:TRINITY_DN7151_c0_g1_i1.p1 TRINITY_DN7151_c0_g1~~TRINITY_DN7151_c0_g1_i1.p1  ORF type:complete len:144 (+),score=18.80 TRINITY_DN7151_c0_g1_i1:385-816(+)
MQKLAVGGKRCIWAVNKVGLPFQWAGDKGWRICSPPASGQITRIACGSDGDTWAVDMEGQAYHWDPDFDWVKVGDLIISEIAVGNKNRVYVVAGSRRYVWKYVAEDDRWVHLQSPCPFYDISAGNDGSVWAVDKMNEVWWLYD